MSDILRRSIIGQVGGAALVVTLAVGSAAAQQSQFGPYYGKNKVQYDHPSWHVYRSPHFEVYYYPEFEQHLGRVVGSAKANTPSGTSAGKRFVWANSEKVL